MIIRESKWKKSKLQQVARYAELRQLISKIIHPIGNINMWFKILHVYVKVSYYAVYSSTSYTIIMNFHFTTKYQKEPLTDFSPDWTVWGPVLRRISSTSSICNCSAGITGAQTINLAEGRQMRVTTKHVSNKKQWSFCKKKVHRGVNVLSHTHQMFCLVRLSYYIRSCSYLETNRPQFSHPSCSSYTTCIQQNYSQRKHTEPQNVSFPNSFVSTTILNFWSTGQLFCWKRILPHKRWHYLKGFPHSFHQSQFSHYLLWRMYLNKLSKNPPSENMSLQLI